MLELSFNEFKKLIKSLNIWTSGPSESKIQNAINVYWRIGGQTGGSCWTTNENPAIYRGINADPEPDLTDLDIILQKICPNISYINYKVLVKSTIKIKEYSIYEYYGNYTNYSIKYILLNDLYKWFVDNNFIIMKQEIQNGSENNSKQEK